ncbi:oxygen-independent coproporphyrinogen III oxidase [Wenxinia saemankumensis]|uniref:Coproporphyrinogen-III oxidase n=1 Tax=Wenxinia saemankumensis TaxID=1447782 RepID=A0A1M6CRB5_9RHOB|nr:oxygen-independent coproporphyrinogen III oxidase [Wenxinia saemankumensis]SHI63499.1 oxygen-independent coproporphyrinogen-3 oxidase [Wenxinia saemankumensis]
MTQDTAVTPSSLRAALLTARVPRYTSYPPADRFGDRVGPAEGDAWLRAVPEGAEVSLYVHVPFCRRLCWFCACRTQGTRTDAPLDRYLDHLEREIAAVRGRLAPVRISALHLGGGTPTLLSADRLDRLGAMLRAAFPIDAATEVSVEIDPTECDGHRLDALMRMGLSRASIGVQDFDPVVQASIGRRQGLDETERAVAGLRARGVRSVNVDLLYGLPHQTLPRLARTLAAIVRLAPERIALYGYAHVPWVARRQKLIPEAALPDPVQRLALAEAAREILTSSGYDAVGIDHFARPGDGLARAAAEGRLHRNFQGYTTDAAGTLIGLGASAISRYAQGYLQNAAATDAWQKALEEGDLPVARGIALTPVDRTIAAIIESLMCYGRVDLAALPDETRPWAREMALAALTLYPGAGELAGQVLRLNDFAAARLVAAVFDPGSGRGGPRYSQAS